MQKRLLLCLVLAFAAFGCGDDDTSKNNATNNATTNNATTNNATTNNATTNNATTNNNVEGPTVTAVTYNAGLAVGFVSLAAERQQPVADALSGLDADFVCLQEVWLTQDGDGNWTQDNIDTILAATSNTYPHNYYEITETMGDGAACTEEEAAPLEMCVAMNCDGVAPGDLAGCVTGNCGEQFGAVSGGCQGCLVGQLGNSFEDIQAACVGGEGGSSYFSNGHNGLLLLSKHPLSNQTETTFPAVQVSRSLLTATAEHPEFGSVDLYCTHLTAAIGGVTYPADTSMFASYEEEQANQISEILTAIGTATNPAILFGDMNTGPALGESVVAELPNNWATFEGSGLFFPAIDESNPFCTYCADNTLIDGSDSVYIDHIMTTWEPTVVRTERLFDETQMIAGEDNNLSDHYGVLVEVGQAQ